MRTTTDADNKHIKVTNQKPGFYRNLHFRRVQKLADEENVGTTKKDTKLALHMTFPIDTRCSDACLEFESASPRTA